MHGLHVEGLFDFRVRRHGQVAGHHRQQQDIQSNLPHRVGGDGVRCGPIQAAAAMIAISIIFDLLLRVLLDLHSYTRVTAVNLQLS